MDAAQRTLSLVKHLGILRPRDLDNLGIARTYLQRLLEQGKLRRVGRGLYALADADLSIQSDLAAVARRVPDAVVCLLTALRVHDLTTQLPFEVWIAIPKRARTPKVEGVPIRVVRMAPGPLAAGVVMMKIDGVQVPVFELEKTVVDCFRFRASIGLDVALEAMREYLRRPRRNLERLLQHAAVDRVAVSMRPYLEAMVVTAAPPPCSYSRYSIT
ncbi:MAG: type IV toxin-antitoxin system AbiEi family antitoxin domain-containing protein [Planctomycetota bacterium]